MVLAWRRRARPQLGTLVEIAVRCDSEDAFLRLVTPAFACVQRIHDAMSFHEATSDVSAIASAAPGARLRIRHETHAVIRMAIDIERETGGVFNVAVADQLLQRGLLPRSFPGFAPHANDERSFDAMSRPVPSALSSLRLEPSSEITVCTAVRIDLGGIAKGAAVDAALAALRDAGVAEAIVNAGGDMAVLGDVAQPVRVRGPGGMHVDVGYLADGAIASSGPFDARGGGALVTPDGHRPRWASRTVSVVAPSCVVADALTKVVAILGPASTKVLQNYQARAFSVDAQGRVEPVCMGNDEQSDPNSCLGSAGQAAARSPA